jgi:hypothetical protein
LNPVIGPYRPNYFAGTWPCGRNSDIQIPCRLQGNQALRERNNFPECLQVDLPAAIFPQKNINFAEFFWRISDKKYHGPPAKSRFVGMPEKSWYGFQKPFKLAIRKVLIQRGASGRSYGFRKQLFFECAHTPGLQADFHGCTKSQNIRYIIGAMTQILRLAELLPPHLNVEVVSALLFRRRPARIYPVHHFHSQINTVSKRHLSCWRGFAIQHRQFPARKDCGNDAQGSFATFIHLVFHRGSRQGFSAKEGTAVYYVTSR